MPTEINQGLKNNSPEPLDAWKGIMQGGVLRPYASTTEANQTIPIDYRSKGMTVLILLNGIPAEYWYRDGIADNLLIPKLRADFIQNQFSAIQTAAFRINGGTNGIMSFNGKVCRIEDVSANINIGERAGEENTGSGSGINMGFQSGLGTKSAYQIAMGFTAGHTVYGNDGIYMGRYAGLVTDGDRNVMIAALAGANSHTTESTMVGYNTSAGEPAINVSIPNTNFLVNSNVITGVSSLLTAAGIIQGQRVAVQLKNSNIQIGNQALVGGGIQFKGIVNNGNIEMQYQGAFTSQGSGNTTFIIIADTINCTVLGRSAHADRSNQVALGDTFVTQMKVGATLRINTSIAPTDGQVLKWSAANGEFRPAT